MGHAVAGDAAFAFGGHQTMGAEAHQVLADRRLRAAEAGGELRDFERALLEGLDDTQAVRMGKGTEGPGAVAENLGVKRLGFRHIQKFECISAGGKGEKR